MCLVSFLLALSEELKQEALDSALASWRPHHTRRSSLPLYQARR